MAITILGISYFRPQEEKNDQSSPSIYQQVDPETSVIESENQESTYEDSISKIDKSDLKEMVYNLADFQVYKGRVTGMPGNIAASEWIKNRLDGYGLKTMYDEFNVGRIKTKNVYAWIEGSKSPEEIIIVGAHFDHILGSPGADDNASGTALVLEIAKAFSSLSKEKIHRTIVFQLYSGEELGLLGSRHYCANPKFPEKSPNIQKHVFMLNADMVGRLSSQQYLMLFEEEMDDVGQMIQDLSNKYPFALSITKRGAGGSDQTPFLNKGISVAWLFTGSHKDYHRPTDTADKIDYEGLEKISRYAFELIYRIDKEKRNLCIAETDYANNTNPIVQYEIFHDHEEPSEKFEYPLNGGNKLPQ